MIFFFCFLISIFFVFLSFIIISCRCISFSYFNIYFFFHFVSFYVLQIFCCSGIVHENIVCAILKSNIFLMNFFFLPLLSFHSFLLFVNSFHYFLSVYSIFFLNKIEKVTNKNQTKINIHKIKFFLYE